MCGRFTLTVHQLGSVIDKLGATIEPELEGLYRPRFNVAPGEQHWVVRHRSADVARVVTPAGWGLINHWAKDASQGFRQINARAETLTQRPAFREAFQKRRCLVLADGFYEWRGPKGSREPLRFHAADDAPLLFAGLYDSWCHPETGEWRKTFTIITTTPNRIVSGVHDRMPAIVPFADVDAWLLGDDPEIWQSLLTAAPDDALMMTPASPLLNKVGHDDPGLLDADDPRVPKQLDLFS